MLLSPFFPYSLPTFPYFLKKQTNNFYLYQRHKCMKLQEAHNHEKHQFFVISAHLLFPKETTFTNYTAAEFCFPLQLQMTRLFGYFLIFQFYALSLRFSLQKVRIQFSFSLIPTTPVYPHPRTHLSALVILSFRLGQCSVIY